MDRQAFRDAVFARDGGRCVFCGAPAVDAHHLLERRLWADGGYHLDNGIAVCARCHLLCEQTVYSVEEGRAAAGIANVVLPDHFYDDLVYDKWGNELLPDGRRSPGELFADPSVQKVLAEGGVLDRFILHVKHPRTYHLPWSFPGKSDRVLADCAPFAGRQVVVTEKMDGENTTLYRDKLHARSFDSASHPSQDWVRNFWAARAHDIPPGYRVCGENVYARHSILYERLPSYFLAFSVWNGDRCLSWDDSLEWFALLDLTPVPVLYAGPWNEARIRALSVDEETSEGYVVRLRDAFPQRAFRTSVAKYVRKDHLRTPERWDRRVVANRLGSASGR